MPAGSDAYPDVSVFINVTGKGIGSYNCKTLFEQNRTKKYKGKEKKYRK